MSTKAGSREVKVGLRFPPCARGDRIAQAIRRAEDKGFDVAWVADSQLLWRDVYAAMALAASQTDTIVLATAVTNFATRHPTVVASAINTIAELAPGRVVLGVGTGDSAVKPLAMRPSRLACMRESIGMVRALLDGDHYLFGNHQYRLRDATGRVPVHLAASGPRALALAGEIADGAITLAGIAPEIVAQTRRHVEEGCALAHRDFADVEFTVGTFCHITNDIERDARALKPICLHLASIGALDFLKIAGIELDPPPYIPQVYPDMVHAEDWDLAVRHASAYVTDEMAVKFAQTFCLFGSVMDIVARMERAAELGATGFYLRHIGNYTLPLELIDQFGGDVLPRFSGPERAQS